MSADGDDLGIGLVDCTNAELVIILPPGEEVEIEGREMLAGQAIIASKLPYHMAAGILRQIADRIEAEGHRQLGRLN